MHLGKAKLLHEAVQSFAISVWLAKTLFFAKSFCLPIAKQSVVQEVLISLKVSFYRPFKKESAVIIVGRFRHTYLYNYVSYSLDTFPLLTFR